MTARSMAAGFQLIDRFYLCWPRVDSICVLTTSPFSDECRTVATSDLGRGYTRRMIHGAHVIIYSKDSEADRAFFRDVLNYESVDAGQGWLIFALPPAEVAVHPSEDNDVHELFLMCDDIQALIAEMKQKKVTCSPIDEQRWGSITRLTLPGGGKLGIYQPKHASPLKANTT